MLLLSLFILVYSFFEELEDFLLAFGEEVGCVSNADGSYLGTGIFFLLFSHGKFLLQNLEQVTPTPFLTFALV